MDQPPSDQTRIYIAIVGMSALLCFALMLTNSVWLTLALMIIGALHMARYFPIIEAYVATDPLLAWVRRITPLLLLLIVGIVTAGKWFGPFATP